MKWIRLGRLKITEGNYNFYIKPQGDIIAISILDTGYLNFNEGNFLKYLGKTADDFKFVDFGDE